MMKKRSIWILSLALMGCLAACGSPAASEAKNTVGETDKDISPELTYSHSMERVYAECFSVDYFNDGYTLLSIAQDGRYLLVPEGAEVPGELEEDIQVLKRPVENLYLSASAVMDMFISLDAVEDLRFSSLQEDSWYVEEAKEAMRSGSLVYAGKYSAPDYEMIVAEGCGLAIENTMIYHTPEVKEQLESVGVPVMVDYSSYEEHPLGRTEWVKVYGALTGREEEAEAAFASEAEAFEKIRTAEKTGDSVAFFYVTTNGAVNVRKGTDYLAKMIELAGGTYIFKDLGDESSNSSTATMQMEEFYAAAKDADYLIYNSSIDGELTSVEDLLDKDSLFSNFKAVQEGKVYGTTKNLYQSSMQLGTIISDIHGMLNGGDEMVYIYHLE